MLPLAGREIPLVEIEIQQGVGRLDGDRPPRGEVDLDLAMLRPNLHLAPRSIADARSAEIRHAAAGKLDPSLSDVFVLTHDR